MACFAFKVLSSCADWNSLMCSPSPFHTADTTVAEVQLYVYLQPVCTTEDLVFPIGAVGIVLCYEY